MSRYKNLIVLDGKHIFTSTGKRKYIDERKYNGHGKETYERADCRCEICGTEHELKIRHLNNGERMLLCDNCFWGSQRDYKECYGIKRGDKNGNI